MGKKKIINNISVSILLIVVAFIMHFTSDSDKTKYYIPLVLIAFAVIIVIDVFKGVINDKKAQKQKMNAKRVYEILKSDYDNNTLALKLSQGYFFLVEASLTNDEELYITFKTESYEINVSFTYKYSYILFRVSDEVEEKLRKYSLKSDSLIDEDAVDSMCEASRSITVMENNIYIDIMNEVLKEAKRYDEISKFI